MKLTNAIKKLEKAGFTVTSNGMFYYAKKSDLRYFVQLTRNGSGDNIATISIKPNGECDDVMSDYNTGIFVDNVSQAIRLAA